MGVTVLKGGGGGGGGASAAAVAAKVTRSADLPIPNNTLTVVTFTVAVEDSDGFFNPAQGNRLTVPAGLGGSFLVGGAAAWAASTLASRIAYIRKNGVSRLWLERSAGASSSGTFTFTASTEMRLADADYLDLAVYQDTTGSLNLRYLSDERSPVLWLARLGD